MSIKNTVIAAYLAAVKATRTTAEVAHIVKPAAPTNVDAVLSVFTKTLTDLRGVATFQSTKATDAAAAAVRATAEAQAADAEVAKANAAIKKIEKFLA